MALTLALLRMTFALFLQYTDMVQSSSIAYHILLCSMLNLGVYLSRVQGQDHTARWPVGELPSWRHDVKPAFMVGGVGENDPGPEIPSGALL